MNDDLDTILGYTYDPYTGEQSTEWITKVGKKIDIAEMVDEHLVNAINFIRRRYNPLSSECKMSKLSAEFNKEAGDVLTYRFANCLAHVRSMVDNHKYKHLWKEALKRGIVDESK
jgi:uncharacterized protein YijF (DUF1287 family)